MTPPVFLLPAPGLDHVAPGDTVAVDGAEGRHAAGVLRLMPGEPIVLVDGDGRRVTGTVASTQGRDAVAVLVNEVGVESTPAPRLTVVQALPKGDRGELAVELLTEIGVDIIVPWSARHCVAQWKGDRAERGHRRWTDAARAAGKQARRARFPQVMPLHETDEVVDLLADADLGLVLHESAAVSISDITPPTDGDVVIVVGPEGGLADDERERFAAVGAHSALLGPTVLRTSSAGLAAAAVLLSRTSRWTPGADRPGMGG